MLVALLVAAPLAAAGCSDDPASANRPISAQQPDPVADFVQFSRTPADSVGGSTLDYIADGLRKLASALDSVDLDGMNLPLDLRVGAVHVILQPTSLEIAEMMRGLALRTAAALATTRERHDVPAGETHDVLARAEAISAGRPLAEQVPAIQAFFEAAARALAAAG